MSPADFTNVHNYFERPVFEAVLQAATRYPQVHGDMLADVACVALNRLPPRYIRHTVDLAFYMTEKERADNERALTEAVAYAFEFVQARTAMRARS
ncbi:late competence development ComFB family protein [Caldimonas taiwanensis]|uniref:late competence development ComFB family protein n=1 Tax=Caldimonas taiwanensis TaxID=307483 RepID=UPI0007821BEF|nr:late competence development ComFB family protein [Caldimonas taiwanensis]